MFWFLSMSSLSVTKMSMWQIEDDTTVCDVTDDADVSVQMLSQKFRRTKTKKQNS